MGLKNIFRFIPEVKGPEEKKVSFNVKLKWTLIVLGSFFILANISLFGLSSNALQRFEYLAIILGTQFGSIISLGVGPIVMASIILQLLVGFSSSYIFLFLISIQFKLIWQFFVFHFK